MSGPTLIDDVVALLGRAAERDVPIGPRTTYRVGGRAAALVEVERVEDLLTLSAVVGTSGVAVLVLGKGSNVLVADRGFDGLIVTLGAGFATLDVDRGAGVVRAGGSLALPVLARRLAADGVAGLEWAVGIPGSVGGAVRMNAGGHGAEVRERLVDAELLSLGHGAARTVACGDLALGYRTSSVGDRDVVVGARFAVDDGDPATSMAEIDRVVGWRRAHQPGGRNGGSVFANPPDDSAGRLIDAAGLKGYRIGTAVVSEKHANFFQVDDGGSADDVRRLIDEVRSRVLDRFGVELILELRLIGFDA